MYLQIPTHGTAERHFGKFETNAISKACVSSPRKRAYVCFRLIGKSAEKTVAEYEK